MGSDNTARESELAANLYAALVASPAFRREFLRLVGAHEPDALGRVDVRFEYTPGASNKRFDIYLRREDPSVQQRRQSLLDLLECHSAAPPALEEAEGEEEQQRLVGRSPLPARVDVQAPGCR